MPTALAAPSSSHAARAEDELSLAELLDLFEHPSLSGSGLRTRQQTRARRTVGWRVVPGGAWRAW